MMIICYLSKIAKIIFVSTRWHFLNLCFSFIFFVATLSTRVHKTTWTRKTFKPQGFPRVHAYTCPRFPVDTKKLTIKSGVAKNIFVSTPAIYNIKGKRGHVKRGPLPLFIFVFEFSLSHRFCHHLTPLSAKQLRGFSSVLSPPAVTKLCALLSLGCQGIAGDWKVGFVTTSYDKTPGGRAWVTG